MTSVPRVASLDSATSLKRVNSFTERSNRVAVPIKFEEFFSQRPITPQPNAVADFVAEKENGAGKPESGAAPALQGRVTVLSTQPPPQGCFDMIWGIGEYFSLGGITNFFSWNVTKK